MRLASKMKETDCQCARCDSKIRDIITSSMKRINNEYGKSALDYRFSNYEGFRQRMLGRLNQYPSLSLLNTRKNDDLAVSVIDAVATIGDVLTFYQERIANEIFLRTCTERKSVVELANTVGYMPRPGAAARVELAFTVEDAPMANRIEQVVIPKGSRVQSIPEEGQMPQIFETTKTIEARPEWNEMRPKTKHKQYLAECLKNREFFFQGTDNQIKIGDGLLVSVGGDKFFVFVDDVKIDLDKQITAVTIESIDNGNDTSEPQSDLVRIDNLQVEKKSTNFKVEELQNYVDSLKLDMNEFQRVNNSKIDHDEQEGILGNEENFVCIFKIHARIFGHNAPMHESLPDDLKYHGEKLVEKSRPTPESGPPDDLEATGGGGENNNNDDDDANTYTYKKYYGIYPINWDSEDNGAINKNTYGKDFTDYSLYLDNKYIVAKNQYLILNQQEGPSSKYSIQKIIFANSETITEFTLVGNTTGLKLDPVSRCKNGNPEDEPSYNEFNRRRTNAFLDSEILKMAFNEKDNEILTGDSILLNKLIIGINKGQLVAVNGVLNRFDFTSERSRHLHKEIFTINSVEYVKDHADNEKIYTRLVFDRSIPNYRIDTVTINANVSSATHGETVVETIGFGNSSKQVLKYKLAKNPLTYIEAITATGVKNTLEIRVDDVLWHQSTSLFGLDKNSKNYVIRHDEAQNTFVLFGASGQLPSFAGHTIEAKYSTGIGLEGLLKENQLTILVDRPLGLKGVTNPLPSRGGVDPEATDSARSNLSLPINALERIVSLTDFEDFARAFTGIGKAKASKLKLNDEELVHLTVAPNDMALLGIQQDYQNLKDNINFYKDFTSKFMVGECIDKVFNISAKILVSSDYLFEKVRDNVIELLRERYSFSSMSLSESVPSSMVIGLIESIDGVEAVDLDYFYVVNPDEPDFSIDIQDILDNDTEAIYEFVKKKINKSYNLEWVRNIQEKNIKTDQFGNIREIILSGSSISNYIPDSVKSSSVSSTNNTNDMMMASSSIMATTADVAIASYIVSNVRNRFEMKTKAIIYLDDLSRNYKLKITFVRTNRFSGREISQILIIDEPITLKQTSRALIANGTRTIKQKESSNFEVLPSELLTLNDASSGIIIEEMVLKNDL
ncbi:MAG: hypothetical protein AB7O87_12035 [Candidatus Nitrosocosmicus sp.]